MAVVVLTLRINIVAAALCAVTGCADTSVTAPSDLGMGGNADGADSAIPDPSDVNASSDADVELPQTDDGSVDPDGDADQPAEGCEPLKKYVFEHVNAVALQCSPSNADAVLFDVDIPAVGRAFSRASFDIVNFAPAGHPVEGAHAWAGQAVTGNVGWASGIHAGAGQTICPGQQLQSQQLMSYGLLDASSQHVAVRLRQYASSGCVNGSLIVQPGARLEVWVEDPECAEKSLVVRSYFRDVRGQDGGEAPFALTTTTADVLSASFVTSEATRALVYGQLEATMPSTTNRCGSQHETAAAVIGDSGAYAGAVARDGWPTSEGETHIALYPQAAFDPLPAGQHRIHLSAAVDQGFNSGLAKAGLDHSGDTVLATILDPSSAVVAATVSVGRAQRIMPLGDSITLGYEDTNTATQLGGNGGYRYLLYHQLANRGFRFDFVGGLAAGPSALPDQEHEGHSGWKTNDLIDGVTNQGWIRATDPDVVLLHVGTNDFLQTYDLQNIPGRLSMLLDRIYADAPQVVVVVATIVPIPAWDAYAPWIANYNDSIGLVVAAHQAAGRRVYVLDTMRFALDGAPGSADYCSDQVHPNSQGYGKMADQWLRALVQIL